MPTVIDEEHVSAERLLALFQRAFLKARMDEDGDVYISSGLEFPIWATVDTEQQLIRFFTFMSRDPNEQPPFTEAGANHLNATVILPAFYVQGGSKHRLCSSYVLPFNGGLLETHVITAARRFAGASAYGARKLDEYAVH